ncbi:MAG: zinc-dependent metalloprotease [Chitinophagales bacterium]
MPNLKKFLLFSLGAVFMLSSLHAQESYCGTQMTDEQMAWLRAFQADYANNPGSERGGTLKYVPVKVHIVGSDDGTGYYTLSNLYASLCQLNERYAETGFYFYVAGDIEYINNSAYNEHDWTDGSNMMEEYNVNGYLNLYMVKDPAGNCGYFSGWDDAVAVANACAMPNGTTIAHEFGHYFSLPHTFYGWEGGTPSPSDQEWVNGANCNAAADGFCDTPPDYLNYRWSCPGPLQTDIHGDTFYSDPTLYMSYALDACTGRFSNEQMDAMNANINGPRDYLLDHPVPADLELSGTPDLVVPENGTFGMYPNYVYFEWTPVENATKYHLQISYSSGFTAIAHDVVTTNNFYEEHDLKIDKTYYWRVKPLTELNTCADYSLAYTFTTGTEFSNVLQSDLFASIAINPNPLQAGYPLQLHITATVANDADCVIYDITGKQITAFTEVIQAGENDFNVELPVLSSGVYFLAVRSGEKSEVQQFIISE